MALLLKQVRVCHRSLLVLVLGSKACANQRFIQTQRRASAAPPLAFVFDIVRLRPNHWRNDS